MFELNRFSAALAVFCLFAAPAAAAPVTFDFTTLGTGQTNSGLDLTSGGVDLRITAVNRSIDTGNPPPNQFPNIRVTYNGDGLGARVNAGDSTEFDSIGPDEALRFRITSLPTGVAALRLEQVVFFGLNVDGTPPASREEFTLTIDNDSIIHSDIRPGTTAPWLVASDIVDPALRTGALNFRFQLESSIGGDNDSFRISSLTFETVAFAVPAPGAIGLLVCGIACLGTLRRR